MNANKLHQAQLSILRSLRHSPASSYTTLMVPTGLESDVFKFHIQKLLKLNYIEKLPSGEYVLTVLGKEFSNSLDKKKRVVQKQPKLSMLLIVERINESGEKGYLLQRRLRHPHWGYWGFMSGPIKWGIDAEATAKMELKKQTGLTADFRTVSFCRQRDYEPQTGDLLEDKLFYLMQADDATGSMNAYPYGENKWMTLQELEQQEKFFEHTRAMIEMVEASRTYFSVETERLSVDF